MMIESSKRNAGEKCSRVVSKSTVFWTWVLGIGMPLALIALRASLLGRNLFLVIPMFLIVLTVWSLNAIWATVLAVQFVRSGQLGRALPLLIFPALLLTSMLSPGPFLYVMNDIGDEIRFLAKRSIYLKETHALPPTSEPRLVEFDLGGDDRSTCRHHVRRKR